MFLYIETGISSFFLHENKFQQVFLVFQAMNSNEIPISDQLLNEILNVPVLPQTKSNISTLYVNPSYLRNAQKK